MEVSYEGYVIKWVDYRRDFDIEKEGILIKSGELRINDCERWIDKKNKQKFKRVKVLVSFGFHQAIIEGEATSKIGDDYVWVVSVKGKDRKKVEIREVWLDTPKNREFLAMIIDKQQQISALKMDINEITANTDRLTAEMMVEDSGD